MRFFLVTILVSGEIALPLPDVDTFFQPKIKFTSPAGFYRPCRYLALREFFLLGKKRTCLSPVSVLLTYFNHQGVIRTVGSSFFPQEVFSPFCNRTRPRRGRDLGRLLFLYA